MLPDYDKFKPVKIGGFFLLLIAFFGFVCLIAILKDSVFRELVFFITAWHLLTGLGVILRTRWGYPVLKAYLYIISYFIFPIGTYIAHKSLRYLEGNNIERFFGDE